MCKSTVVRSWLTIFLTAEFRRKRAKTCKVVGGRGGVCGMGAIDQPRYNGFHVIRDRVITVLQYTSFIYFVSPIEECYPYCPEEGDCCTLQQCIALSC